MTWHRSGLVDIADGMVQWQNRCVGTDPVGDQIASEGASDGGTPPMPRAIAGSAGLQRHWESAAEPAPTFTDMYVVAESDAAAIPEVYERDGELSASKDSPASHVDVCKRYVWGFYYEGDSWRPSRRTPHTHIRFLCGELD
jgi:hypothetical protein